MRTLDIVSLASLAALSACAPDFVGPERVKGLRVLAVRAEPPEISAADQPGWPPAATAIQSLIGHPGFAAGDDAVRALVLHLACTPTPGDPLGTVCTQISALSDPAALLAPLLAGAASACTSGGAGVVNGMTISGLEACSRRGCGQLSVQRDPADPSSLEPLPAPSYQLPAGFWDPLAAASPQRIIGTDVVDLALAVEASGLDVAPAQAAAAGCENVLPGVLERLLVLWQERAHVPSLKWIHVRGPDMPTGSTPEELPNLNPQVVGIRLGTANLPAVGAGPQRLPAGRAQQLLPDLGGDFQSLRQTYDRYDTSGVFIDTRQEDWAYSWFATAGDLDQSHTNGFGEENAYTLGGGHAVLWLVVRDLRGGEAWTAAEVQAP